MADAQSASPLIHMATLMWTSPAAIRSVSRSSGASQTRHSMDMERSRAWSSPHSSARHPSSVRRITRKLTSYEHGEREQRSPWRSSPSWSAEPARDAPSLVHAELGLSPVRASRGADEQGRQLVRATVDGDPMRVQQLLTARANIEHKGVDGCTPLILAACFGHEEVVRLLLAAGARIDAASQSHSTAILEAAEEGHERIVRMLLDAGAYTEAAFKHGFTPLIVTARAGREGCARLLLEAGANREARDRHGKTALDHARAEGQTSLAALLECPAPAPALAPLLESPAPAAALVRPSASRLAYHRGHSRLTAVAGLETLLAGCNLSDSVDAALAWCEAQGVDSIAMLREVEMEQDLASALGLKPAKAKQLIKRIALEHSD